MKKFIFNDKKKIVYIMEEIFVRRGIRNKGKTKADEVLIHGMSYKNFEKKYNVKIDDLKGDLYESN